MQTITTKHAPEDSRKQNGSRSSSRIVSNLFPDPSPVFSKCFIVILYQSFASIRSRLSSNRAILKILLVESFALEIPVLWSARQVNIIQQTIGTCESSGWMLQGIRHDVIFSDFVAPISRFWVGPVYNCRWVSEHKFGKMQLGLVTKKAAKPCRILP